MGKAIQHRAPLGKGGHRAAVVFLVQKKACFLAVLHIHRVVDAVFANMRQRRPGQRQAQGRKVIPSLVLGKALFFAQGHVVALVQPADILPVGAQHLHQRREQRVFQPLHTHAQHLGRQKRAVPVHRQAGKLVCLAENDAAV